MLNLSFVVCEGGVAKIFMAIGYALVVVKVAIPIVLLVMGAMDFMKAIFGADPKSFSTSIITLVQRVIAGVIIFFIPSIMYIIIDIISDASNNKDFVSNGGFTVCNECMFHPTKCCSQTVDGHGACEVGKNGNN